MLPYDNVSFSGKKNVQEQPEHVQKSISLGKKIIKFARVNQLSYPTLEKILNENSPVPIHVDDIKNDTHLAAFSGKPVAHMLPLYNYDFKLTAANIYLGTIPQTSKEETDFIANVAHEYSHVLQRTKKECNKLIFKRLLWNYKIRKKTRRNNCNSKSVTVNTK